ncbi:MAG: hypothetical protein OEV30_04965 [Ignavibacteria bacterium]|nr:hypothetical protein [Ignavibacteria bacterium]
MRELLLVLQFKLTSFLKGIARPSWQAQLKNLSSLIVFGGFALGTFLVTKGVTGYLLETANIGLFLYHRFLSMVLYVFFITVNIGNVIVCYATLYRSEEVSFMMSLPISHAKIFLVRFVDNFFYSSSTLALIGIAAVLGYSAHFDLPWYVSFFSIVAVFLPYMLIAGIIAVITLMGLIRAAGLIGFRWLLTGVAGVYLGAVYFYFKTTNPVALVNAVMEHYPDVNAYFGYLDPPLVRYLPNHWVSEFLYWSVAGTPDRAIPFFMFLFFTMIGLITVAGLLARKLYYKTWLTVSDASALRGTRSGRHTGPGFLRFDRYPWFERVLLGNNMQTTSLFKRDFWMFFRDPGQWLHFLLMVLLLMIFMISVRSLELPATLPLMRAVSYLVVFMFIGFLIASIALRFVFPALSLEGRCFWAVRTSPMSLTRLYFHKLGFALLLIALLAEVLAFGSLPIFSPDPFLTGIGALCAFFAAVALTTLHLGTGALFALFREKNPIRVASSHGASLAFLGSMLYLTVLVLLLVVPLNNYFQAQVLPGRSPESQFLVPVGIIALISIVIAFFSTRAGLSSIRKDY